VNVAAQQRDPESLLNWLERMTRLRMRCAEFGTAECEWLETSDPAILAHRCSGPATSAIAVHNFSSREIDATVTLGNSVDGLYDLLKNKAEKVDASGRQRFKLPPYGYCWLRAGRNPESLSAEID
jgi:maltose alpha-D-glucosyltransferase/alpha-amylase